LSLKMKFQVIVALTGLVSACSCLPGFTQQTKTGAPAKTAPQASAQAKAAAEVDQFTPAQKAALAAKRKKWLLAQRSEAGGTGEGAWQLIHRPMDLPNLPQYTGTGATFVEGLMYPNKPGGAAISLTYQAKEAPDVVMSWYEEALVNYHWKVSKAKSEKGAVMAVNGDNGVTINVKPAKSKVYRTDLKITFKLAHK
jgi:hypothetical protein